MSKYISTNKNVYTIIYHAPRMKFKLSINEYCLADSIFHLSNNPSSKCVGWCYASMHTLAKSLGFSRSSAYKYLRKLIAMDLVVKHPDTKNVKVTEMWIRYFTNVNIS